MLRAHMRVAVFNQELDFRLLSLYEYEGMSVICLIMNSVVF